MLLFASKIIESYYFVYSRLSKIYEVLPEIIGLCLTLLILLLKRLFFRSPRW